MKRWRVWRIRRLREARARAVLSPGAGVPWHVAQARTARAERRIRGHLAALDRR